MIKNTNMHCDTQWT